MTTATSFRCAAASALTALAFSSDVSAQAAPPNAWRMLPALPTTCYVDDDFSARLGAAGEALQAEVDRQKQVNDAARERFDNMDMQEKAQRMQAFMMRNPEAAMKMLQTEQAAGTSAQAKSEELTEAGKRLDAELERLQAAFRAAADLAVKPIQARTRQLIDMKTITVGEAAVAMFTSAADHAQYVQLVAEENAAYEKACAPYFGPGGSFHRWVSSYRTEIFDKLVAHEGAGDAMMIVQMQALDLPGGGYRSTYALEQAYNFRTRLHTIWAIRYHKAEPTVRLRK
jgi:hypothetical protein